MKMRRESKMARACHFIVSNFPQSSSLSKPKPYFQKPSHACCSNIKSFSSTSITRAEIPQNWKKMTNKDQKAPRPLIKISTSDGKWHDEWKVNHIFTLRELRLADLAQDGEQDEEVLVGLSIQKHAGFGFSVEGRIITSYTAKCGCCLTPYCREIDTDFNVWVLPSTKTGEFELPEIGGNDPSVIYVKPGSEADLDSLIRDSIRLAASIKDTCSEFCEKSTPRWQYIDNKVTYDQRWRRLIEIRDSLR